MKRLRLLGFVILIPFLFFLACKKKNPGQPPVYVSYQLKSYFDYKVGSYWIYKDTVTGDEDSFSVYSYTDDTTSINNVSTETVSINMRDYTIYKASITDSAEWDFTLQENNSGLRYNSLPTSSSAFHYVTYSPLTEGIPFNLLTGNISTPNCSATNYAIKFLTNYNTIDSTITNPSTYSNVYQINYQSASGGCSPAALNDWIYITKSFGIVKMNINNSYLKKVLELQSCHINH
jgi:hypothetical protein